MPSATRLAAGEGDWLTLTASAVDWAGAYLFYASDDIAWDAIRVTEFHAFVALSASGRNGNGG